MSFFGRCGQCGRPIEESKRTCGANMVVCNKCKMIIHIHCIGEHKLRHKNEEQAVKSSVNPDQGLFSRFLASIKRILNPSYE